MILDFVGAVLVVGLFAILIHVIGLVGTTKEVLTVGRQAAATLRDTTLTDEEKERRTQQNSLRLFRLLTVLVFGIAIALFLPLALIWLMQLVSLVSLGGVMDMLLRWDFIIGVTVLSFFIYISVIKWRRRNS